jgi:hypothetical protein
MHARLQTLLLASIAIVALGLANGAAPTTTTTTTTTTTAQQGKVNRAKTAKKAGHCVTILTKTDNPTICYDTFTAAMAAVTGGKVTDAPADVRAAMKDQGLLARLNVSSDKKEKGTARVQLSSGERIDVHVLTIYCDNDFSGCVGAHSATFSGPPCDDTLFTEPPENKIPYVGDDWNDDFESFRGFNGCWAQVFEHANFGGASLPFASERRDLGVLDDEASSIILQ